MHGFVATIATLLETSEWNRNIAAKVIVNTHSPDSYGVGYLMCSVYVAAPNGSS